MTVVYASAQDYSTWVGDSGIMPTNISQLLRSASLLIAEETKAAYYDADADTSLPTDPTILQAFNDATCAQAMVWAQLGIDPNLGGLDVQAPKRGKGIGTARIDYDTSVVTSAAAFAARQQLVTGLCLQAQTILRQVGVLSMRTWTYG